MEKVELAAAGRSQTGKQVRALRESGQVPAVVYGHGTEPVNVSVGARTLAKVYALAGTNKIVQLSIDDASPRNVLIHEVQTDGRTGDLRHVDFYQVKMNEKIKTEIPLHFVGESVAVYKLEGSLMRNLETVEVEALPANLPESLEVDISVLDDFDKAIHVSDLAIPSNVELLTEGTELIAKVEPPRSDEELEALDEAVVEELPEGASEGDEPSEEVIVEESGGNKDKEPKPERKEAADEA